jgi:hypothetical protein
MAKNIAWRICQRWGAPFKVAAIDLNRLQAVRVNRPYLLTIKWRVRDYRDD